MEQNYVNRENYEKVAKLMGNDVIYNTLRGFAMDFCSKTIINVDNTEGKATEVLECIVAYADAILYAVDRWEPAEPTDSFEFIFDDGRYELDVGYMIHDAEDSSWEEWMELREKVLHAKQIRIEYAYAAEGIDAEDLVSWGIQRLLSDMLEGGRLASCVSVWTRVIPGEVFPEEDGLALQHRHSLWMNGLYNGRYVCGEIPFEKDEALVRSYGGWRQSDDANEEDGIYLQLHTKTSQGLLNRLRKAAMVFSRKVDCNMELQLSDEDYRRNYLKMHSEDGWGDLFQSTIDKDTDDREQRNFPDLRVYFTPEEKQMLLNYYPTLSQKYVQYADPSYTADDLERIRFLWTLVLIGKLEGPEYTLKHGCFAQRPTSDVFMQVFNKLPEEIRIELYGIRNYDLSMDSKAYGVAIEDIHHLERQFFYKHSGIGDFSIMDDQLYARIYNEGYFMHVNKIHLKDIDDVHLLCDFLNDMKEIERLAQIETGEPLPRTNKWIEGYLLHYWYGLHLNNSPLKEDEMKWRGAELEKAEAIPKLTIREYYDQIFQNEPEGMNCLHVYEYDDVTFEPDENSLWARLRFRLENGKYIYEIAQLDV